MPSPAILDDPLLTPAQAGALLGVAPNTLANWRAQYGQARLAFVKLNDRDVRYRHSTVQAYVAAREAATPAASRAASAAFLLRSQRAAA
jgi:hypothetical protein